MNRHPPSGCDFGAYSCLASNPLANSTFNGLAVGQAVKAAKAYATDKRSSDRGHIPDRNVAADQVRLKVISQAKIVSLSGWYDVVGALD